MSKNDVHPQTIRWPQEMWEKVNELAETEERSFNGQVIYMIGILLGPKQVDPSEQLADPSVAATPTKSIAEMMKEKQIG